MAWTGSSITRNPNGLPDSVALGTKMDRASAFTSPWLMTANPALASPSTVTATSTARR